MDFSPFLSTADNAFPSFPGSLPDLPSSSAAVDKFLPPSGASPSVGLPDRRFERFLAGVVVIPPVGNPAMVSLPAVAHDASIQLERDSDFPEDSLQSQANQQFHGAAHVLVLSQDLTSADKTNKLEPAATAIEKIARAIVAQAETTGTDETATVHLLLAVPGLGSVRVHLSVSDHAVSARLVVQEETTQQLLESQVGLLRDRLIESGMTLGRFSVTRDDGGSAGQQQAPHDEAPAWAVPPCSGRAPTASTPSLGNGPRGAIDVIA
jgi:Flagellar hook-length control protein FliK